MRLLKLEIIFDLVINPKWDERSCSTQVIISGFVRSLFGALLDIASTPNSSLLSLHQFFVSLKFWKINPDPCLQIVCK